MYLYYISQFFLGKLTVSTVPPVFHSTVFGVSPGEFMCHSATK